ncbi:unnamed protein product, partial [Fusarium graminearum]
VITTGEVSTTSSQAEITGEAVIFFVAPDTDNQRRSLVKRVTPGGFINRASPVDICTDADTFQLTDGQLLDNGSPIYYNGEPYKQFGSDDTLPDGAITREFASVNGRLVFASRSLPSNNAGFCQDDTGQVYITFGSSPPGCDPIILQVYTVEQCLNGEIPGPAQASSIISESTQSPVPEPTSTVLADTTDTSPSTDTSPVLTGTHSTDTAEEEETASVASSSTVIPSQPSLFTSSLSLTLSEISTIASQSAPLLPTYSSTDSTVATLSTDISSYSESSLLQPASSTLLSTDSTATEPFTEETTTSISTTTLAEESETSSLPISSTQLETTTTAEANATTETTTVGEEAAVTDTTTTEEETTATDITTADDETIATETTTIAEETTTTAEGALATETTTTAEATTATETTTTAEETTATETTTAEEGTTATETGTTATETTTTAEETTATDTTAIAEDTTTTAEETIPTTVTTTTGCDSVAVLSTVALLNPTPIFVDSSDHDDEAVEIVLPFDVARSGQRKVYVSTNGVISVGSDVLANNAGNVELPTDDLPPIALCAYWDDLILVSDEGNTIVYEVFDGQHGTQATFEWIVNSFQDGSLVHFSATLYKDFPQVTRFSYYFTDGGGSATTGGQDRNTGDTRQISFDEPDSVVDGTAVFFNFETEVLDRRSFDNTECGKGDPFDRSSAFNNPG